jgi:recA bacterial DNA recombination protein
MVKSGAIGLVVYDSVAATTTAEEMESQLEDQKIALVARLFSRVLKKLISLFSQTDTTLLLINQTRVKIG